MKGAAMTLRHFQIFNTVCQEGSLTAAAQRLGISQPAVSIAIKELEAFYGTRLFERMNRRIYISPSGEALLQYVGTVLSQFDESVRVIRDEDYATECRFGVNVTVGETRLGDFMAGARAAQPAVQARVVVENSAAIEEMLLHNRIDFAVIDEPSALPGCASEPIYREAMAVVCAPEAMAVTDAPETPAAVCAPGTPATVGATGTPAMVGAPGTPAAAITLEELAAKPLLLRETGSGSRTTVDRIFGQRGLVVRPVLESVSTLALIHMARAGLGYAILPEAVVREEIKKGGLAAVALADGAFDRTYYLIVHQNKFLTRAAREMMAVIRGCAAGSGQP